VARPPRTGGIASPVVRTGLAALEAVLHASVASDDAELERAARELAARGGKRLRPAVLLLARGGRRVDRAALRAAAAVELLHLASLCHDDIMDRSTTRRGAPSANRRYGNGMAALLGTHLFARAVRLLGEVGDWAVQLGSGFASRLCAGQLHEVESAFDCGQSVEEHLEILRLKTSSLFELPGQLGAVLGGRGEAEARAIQSYCSHLGLAFQVQDDCLDVWGDGRAMGKQAGHDMAEGVYSLPVLFALREGGEAGARLAALLEQRELSAADERRCLEIVRSCPAARQARAFARGEAERARHAVRALRVGAVRRSFDALAHLAVERAA
jgi:geranylgeranyl pyrophosphate synthase